MGTVWAARGGTYYVTAIFAQLSCEGGTSDYKVGIWEFLTACCDRIQVLARDAAPLHGHGVEFISLTIQYGTCILLCLLALALLLFAWKVGDMWRYAYLCYGPTSAGAAPQPQEQDDWPCANTLKDLSGAFGAASPTRGIRRFRLFYFIFAERRVWCTGRVALRR